MALKTSCFISFKLCYKRRLFLNELLKGDNYAILFIIILTPNQNIQQNTHNYMVFVIYYIAL